MQEIPDNSVRHQSIIEDFLSHHLKNGRFRGAVIGLSGGIDSAVIADLARNVLPGDKIRVFFLPERDTSPESEEDARLLSEHLGLELLTFDLTPALAALDIYKNPAARVVKKGGINRVLYRFSSWLEGEDAFSRGFGPQPSGVINTATSFYRSKHRMRMTCLFYQAEYLGFAVLGGLNRSEYLTGFFVPHGDDGAHLAPILPLYKTEVFHLARHLGLPQKFLGKTPSPDLVPGLDDEFILGMEYELLDRVLWALEAGCEVSEITEKLAIEARKVSALQSLVNKIKMSAFPFYPQEIRELPGSEN